MNIPSISEKMSKALDENRCFLNLFLSTTPSQQRALIESLTESQAQLIGEIAFNLPRLPLDTSERKFLKSRIPLLQVLANKKKSAKVKARIIKENRIPITRILNYFSSKLKGLLS